MPVSKFGAFRGAGKAACRDLNDVAQGETMGNQKSSTNDDRVAMARSAILERARRGEISPERAETEAMISGCYPLVQFPGGSFDPLQERHWTIFMAVAWIVTRNPHAVCKLWNQYRSKCTKWVESPLTGADGAILEGRKSWTIQPLGPLTGGEADELVSSMAGVDAICQPDAAQSELQHALEAGDIVARGTAPESGIQEPILPDDWSRIYWLEDGRSQPAHCVFDISDQVLYSDVSVESRAVTQKWPSGDELDAQAFGRPIWTIDMVLHWIENRSHVGFQSWARLRQLVWTSSTTAGRDTQGEHALEDALCAGKVKGYLGGPAAPREYWFGKSVKDESDVFFQRSEITKEWPRRKVEPRRALTLAEAESAICAREKELAKPLNQGEAVEILMSSFEGRVTRDGARQLAKSLGRRSKQGRTKRKS